MPKISGLLAVAVASSLVAGGCAGPPPVVRQTIRDSLIIPGERIGPIYVDMTVAEVYAIAGEAKKHGPFYIFDNGMSVVINPRGLVGRVLVTSPQFAAADGVRVGLSDFALGAKREPRKILEKYPELNRLEYCYSGMEIGVTDGVVTSINVPYYFCGR